MKFTQAKVSEITQREGKANNNEYMVNKTRSSTRQPQHQRVAVLINDSTYLRQCIVNSFVCLINI